MLKFIGEGNLDGATCLLALIVLTIFVYGDYRTPLIRAEDLDSYGIRPSDGTLKRWKDYFSHPVQRDPQFKSQVISALENQRSGSVKSRNLY